MVMMTCYSTSALRQRQPGCPDKTAAQDCCTGLLPCPQTLVLYQKSPEMARGRADSAVIRGQLCLEYWDGVRNLDEQTIVQQRHDLSLMVTGVWVGLQAGSLLLSLVPGRVAHAEDGRVQESVACARHLLRHGLATSRDREAAGDQI
jgi:hypothetical protein